MSITCPSINKARIKACITTNSTSISRKTSTSITRKDYNKNVRYNNENKEYNAADEIRLLNSANAYRIGFQAIQSLVNNADVEDNRIRFY